MKNAAGTRSRLVAGLFSKPPLPTLEDLRPAAKFENIDQLVIDTLKAQAAPGVRAFKSRGGTVLPGLLW